MLDGRLVLAEARVAAPQRAFGVDDDLLELVPGHAGVGRAIARLLGHQPLHPLRERGVGARGKFRDGVGDVLHQHRDRCALGAVGHLAREQLERHHARLVEVGPGADLLRHGLLGRHVGRRPDRRARGREHLLGGDLLDRLGDPEVGDLHAAFAGDQQVLGLDVAVDDPAHLGVRERGQQPFQHARDLGQRHPPHERPQRTALEVLHRDVRHPIVLEEVEHRHHVRDGSASPRPAPRG